MSRNGEPIESIEIKDLVYTGIDMEPLLPGLVPLYEEREAAFYCNYSWREWQQLEPYERAENVAHFRLKRLIDLHNADAMNVASAQRQRRADMMAQAQRNS